MLIDNMLYGWRELLMYSLNHALEGGVGLGLL